MLHRLLTLLLIASIAVPSALAAAMPSPAPADPAAICCGDDCRCGAECPCRAEAAPSQAPVPAIPAAVRTISEQPALPKDARPVVVADTGPRCDRPPAADPIRPSGGGRMVLLRKSVLRT
jgi:hypothetical protein